MPASEHTWGCQLGMAEMAQATLMGTHRLCRRAGLGGAAPRAGEMLGGLWGTSRARDVSSQVDMSWGQGLPWPPAQVPGVLSAPQHDGQPYCHKPCYGILFGPKGECLGAWGVQSCPGAREKNPSCFCPHAGVNTGAVGSYIYDKDPEAKNQP